MDEMLKAARSLLGLLTCTIHMDEAYAKDARGPMPILQRKAGSVLASGFPVGSEDCDSTMYGEPYPASTNSRETSVGALSIRRFLRPVCYQNMPESV